MTMNGMEDNVITRNLFLMTSIPPWFDRRDKDFAALQKVILEPTLLDSLKYYVKFR